MLFKALQMFECVGQVGLLSCHCIGAVAAACNAFRGRAMHAPCMAFAVERARVVHSAGDPVLSYHR